MDANSRLKPSINYFSRFIVPLGPLLIALILLAEGSLNITGYIRGQYGEDELFDLPVGISRAEGEEPAQASQPPARQLRPLELYRTETVHDMIRFLLEKRPDIITQGFQRSGRYLPMIRSIFRQEGLPLELSYLAAVESNFHPLARSSQNAMGLWQLMSSTARRFGLTVNAPWYDERLDPELSTRAAARLLKYLHDKYGSWELALAAYNAGEGRVNRAIRTARANGMATDYWSLPLPRETRGFVPTFLAMAEIHGNPEMYGLTGHLVEKPLEYGTLTWEGSASLDGIADHLGVSQDLLTELNPAWRLGLLPPRRGLKAVLRVPPGTRTETLDSLPASEGVTAPWVVHNVSRGQTISLIAREYGVSIRDVLVLNGLKPNGFIRIGQSLLIPLEKPMPESSRREEADDKATTGNAETAGIQAGPLTWTPWWPGPGGELLYGTLYGDWPLVAPMGSDPGLGEGLYSVAGGDSLGLAFENLARR